MGGKEANKALAEEFLLTAKTDLRSAEVEFKAGIFNNSAYHSQQAAEKIIKSLLIMESKFVESHFVANLAKEIVKDELVIEYVKSLEKNWIIARYPFKKKTEIWSPVKQYTKKDAQDALKKAKFVFKTLKKMLKDKYGVSIEEEVLKK